MYYIHDKILMFITKIVQINLKEFILVTKFIKMKG